MPAFSSPDSQKSFLPERELGAKLVHAILQYLNTITFEVL